MKFVRRKDAEGKGLEKKHLRDRKKRMGPLLRGKTNEEEKVNSSLAKVLIWYAILVN